MRISNIIAIDSYRYYIHNISIFIFKPIIIGPVIFLIYYYKNNSKLKIAILDILLIFLLIIQVCNLIEIMINYLISTSDLC